MDCNLSNDLGLFYVEHRTNINEFKAKDMMQATLPLLALC